MSEEKYKISAKGFLAVRTGLMSEMDDIWAELTEFVKNEAENNGMTEGVPCLVMVDGGVCITAEGTKTTH